MGHTHDGRLKAYAVRSIKYHPLIKRVLELVAQSPMSDDDICARAGVGRHYLVDLRRGRIENPRLIDIEAVFNLLGRRLEDVEDVG